MKLTLSMKIKYTCSQIMSTTLVSEEELFHRAKFILTQLGLRNFLRNDTENAKLVSCKP